METKYTLFDFQQQLNLDAGSPESFQYYCKQFIFKN